MNNAKLQLHQDLEFVRLRYKTGVGLTFALSPQELLFNATCFAL